jgi:hypothetical protein
MQAIHIIRRHSLFIVVPLVLLVTILAACGTNGTTGGNNPTSAPTTAPPAVNGDGCPSNAVVNTAPAAANVMVKMSDANKTITVHNGDVIEIRLPYGQAWTGPTASQGALELQTPSGYALPTDKVCVWRFVAKGTGTTNITFYGRAICKKGAMCAQYILDVPITIDVK